jgi:DNA (cytosine-5)-methyltransferase 1
MLQCALQLIDNDKIDLSSAPWTMHEFFAGSGLVAYGLKNMFAPVWANDISQQKADVYKANFYSEHFLLEDIKNVKGADLPYAHLSWASFPCQDYRSPALSAASTLAEAVWYGSGLGSLTKCR